MRTHSVIEKIFGAPGRVAVLRKLALVGQPLTGRQVAELSGLTHRGAIQALRVLVEEGVVTRRIVGRAHQYGLARGHVVVEQIVIPALAGEERLADILKEELLRQFSRQTVSLVLFGSFARGEETGRSDVDVLAITTNRADKEKVERLAEAQALAFNQKFGAMLSVHVLSVGELKSRRHLAFVKEARRDGIVLHGKDLEELTKQSA